MLYIQGASAVGACLVAYDDFVSADGAFQVLEATGTPTMKFLIIHSYYITLMAAVAVSPM